MWELRQIVQSIHVIHSRSSYGQTRHTNADGHDGRAEMVHYTDRSSNRKTERSLQ